MTAPTAPAAEAPQPHQNGPEAADDLREREHLFVGGRWVAARSRATTAVVDPSTEQVLSRAPLAQEGDVDAAVAAARTAFDDPGGWAHWAPEARAEALARLADAVQARAERTAAVVSRQNGMPISGARALEGAFPPAVYRYYADLARTSSVVEDRSGVLGGRVRVSRHPLGVVGGVVPWNFPATIAAYKVAPALAAGCTVVLKPSPETLLDSYLLAEAALEADLPAGVLNIVGGGRDAGRHLVAHPGVDRVSFTGSSAAGREVAEVCGRRLVPATLELGGKAAAVVLHDADLAGSAEAFLGAALLNTGQGCVMSTRVLAPRSRYGEVVDFLTDLVRSQQTGDPGDPATRFGPMVTAAQRERVEGFIAAGRASGARLTTGGGRPRDLPRGYYVEPTVFADVEPADVLFQQEVFGPVLTVTPYDGVDDAIAKANDSAYGLAGTVWGADEDAAAAVAARMRTGMVGLSSLVPDPVAPWGGLGASGYGRELGPEGLAECQRVQAVLAPPA